MSEDPRVSSAVRIAAIADLHIGARHMGRLLEHGQHSALADQERALDFVVATCRRENVRALLIAGDTTHSSHPDVETLAMLGRFYRGLAEARIEVVTVAGNHDPALPSVTSEFRGLISAIATPQVVYLNGLDVACLPWLPDRYVRAELAGDASREDVARALVQASVQIIRQFVTQRRTGVPMVLLTHATIAGSVTSTGFDMGSVRSEWSIDPSEMQDFDLTIAGHVHKPQYLDAARVVVPGSLQPLDFSESEPRMMWIADALGRSEVHLFPKTIPSRDVSTWDVVGDDLPEILAGGYASEGELVRIRATVTRGEAQQIPPAAIARALYGRGAGLVQVEYTVASEDRARDGDMRTGLSPLQALERYIEQTEAPEGDRMLVMADAITGETETARGLSGVGGLTLRRICLVNFLSIAAADVALDDAGVIAVTGANGAGKSALAVDAIRWALTGVSRHGARGADRLIRRGAAELSVALTFTTEDTRTLRVVRKLKRGTTGRTTGTLDVLVADARELVTA